MKSPDLSRLVTGFFLTHLAAERNVSHNTANRVSGRLEAIPSVRRRLT